VPDVEWFGPDGAPVDWGAVNGSLACFFAAPAAEPPASGSGVEAGDAIGVARDVLIVAHAGLESIAFSLPRPAIVRDRPWRLFVHTGREPPDDVQPDGSGPLVDVERPLELPPRSLVCLVADVRQRRSARAGTPRK